MLMEQTLEKMNQMKLSVLVQTADFDNVKRTHQTGF